MRSELFCVTVTVVTTALLGAFWWFVAGGKSALDRRSVYKCLEPACRIAGPIASRGRQSYGACGMNNLRASMKGRASERVKVSLAANQLAALTPTLRSDAMAACAIH
jgi:hypothetical protein